MPASTFAGERIRTLAGEGVPGITVLVVGPEGVRAAGAAGLADIAGLSGLLARHGKLRLPPAAEPDAATAAALDHLGLGWFRPASQRNADPPFVEHLGGGAGFFNLIRIYPTRSVGVAIMGNATKYHIDAVARLALTE